MCSFFLEEAAGCLRAEGKMVKETLKTGGEEPKRGQGRQNKVNKDAGKSGIRISGWKDHFPL